MRQEQKALATASAQVFTAFTSFYFWKENWLLGPICTRF